MTILDHLSELEAKATAGEWRARWDHKNVDIKSTVSTFPILEGGNSLSGERMRDAAFIASIRNHAKALIDVARAAKLVIGTFHDQESQIRNDLITALARLEGEK